MIGFAPAVPAKYAERPFLRFALECALIPRTGPELPAGRDEA